MQIERTWILLARKLADEITEEELKELEKLLSKNNELQFQASVLMNLWQTNKNNNTDTRKGTGIKILLEKIKTQDKNFRANKNNWNKLSKRKGKSYNKFSNKRPFRYSFPILMKILRRKTYIKKKQTRGKAKLKQAFLFYFTLCSFYRPIG